MKLVLPPPDIRKIIDKTAQFISTRGGEELEKTIRDREQGNSKFSFLAVDDPYHAYYLVQLEVMEETGELLEFGESHLAEEDEENVDDRGDKRQKIHDQQEEQHRQQLPKLPELDFRIDDMPKISSLDLDIIKLTALFVARNGDGFIQELKERERGNIQFEFVNAGHSCHSLFQQLIKQYKMIMEPSREMLDEISLKSDKFKLLERCVDRSQLVRYEEQDRIDRQRELDQDEERRNLIDWHDFVIVQTIDFTDWDQLDDSQLPLPLSIKQLQSMTLAERQSAFDIQSASAADEGGEQEMEMSEED